MLAPKSIWQILPIFFIPFACNLAQAEGIFNARCTYSHTLADDSIVHYGLPGQTMVHDFFGNTGTDAYSDYSTLITNKVTTCDVAGDISAYWTPQLKRASGIVTPDFTKTYYRNLQPVVPLQAPPPGLEVLAGNHMGSSPNPNVNFLCRGGSYTTTAPTHCPVVTDSSGTYARLDISIHFPDCWDGVNLKPDFANGIQNMAYRQADGTCPTGYPVKIPELQVNEQFSLGQDPDLSTAQLSMDPMMMNGQWVPQWGSLYTAHADFINAWKTDTMQYAINNCSNANTACSNSLPTYYSTADANAWINTSGVVTTSGTVLHLAPGEIVMLKFPTPVNTTDYPWSKAWLQTLGQNTTDANAVMLDIYAATTQWSETSPLPQPAECSTQHIGGIYLNNANQQRLNDITPYVKNAIASGQAETGLCIRNNTAETITFSSRTSTLSPALYLQ
jgi:hypothetical protein